MRLSSWEVKSSDSKVTVKVKKNRRGKEVGKAHYFFADGTDRLVDYTPRPAIKFPTRLTGIVPLSAGFLAGILLEVFTHFLKLR